MNSAKPGLILASTSPYRQAQLSQLGYSFESKKPICDEDAIKEQLKDPIRLATTLAEMKAQSLASPDSCVIGGDQVCSIDSLILGKPLTFEKACEQLAQLSGQKHRLVTAACVLYQGISHSILNVTLLTMRKLTSAEISEYVKRDQPLDCAGSYKIEKSGIALFEKIETDDSSAIQGLPLIKLSETLRRLGFYPA